MHAVLGGEVVTSFAMPRVRARRRRRRPDPHAPFLWRQLALALAGMAVQGLFAGYAWSQGDVLWATGFGLGASFAGAQAWACWAHLLCGRALDDEDPEAGRRYLEEAVRAKMVADVLWVMSMVAFAAAALVGLIA